MSLHPFKHLMKKWHDEPSEKKKSYQNLSNIEPMAKVSVSTPNIDKPHDEPKPKSGYKYEVVISKNGISLNRGCFKYLGGRSDLRFMTCDNQPAIKILPVNEKPFSHLKVSNQKYCRYYNKELLKHLVSYCHKSKSSLDLSGHHYRIAVKFDHNDGSIIVPLGKDRKIKAVKNHDKKGVKNA